jgi:ribose-phosphate pyrophosphokinase
VFALHGHDALAAALVTQLDGEAGILTLHRFPDGESYLRYDTPVAGRAVILVCNLHDPDAKIPQLLFAAAAARELGAAQTGLVAPYLVYMRQDRKFQPGEALTSVTFASLISNGFDWLVTVDPHLHRYHALSDIYSIPSRVVPAAPAIAQWIKENVTTPWLIGPDEESAQWVAAVARAAGAPFAVLEKIRRGDRDVEVSVPDAANRTGHTPVLVDDIISTGRTMARTITHLQQAGLPPPVCIGVHAVFAPHAYEELLSAGAQQIVTCNTVPHSSNAITLNAQIAAAVSDLLPR